MAETPRDDLAAKLSRLRREVREPAPEVERTAELPAHFLANLARRAAPTPLAHLATRGAPTRLERSGEAWARVERFEREHMHGDVELARALDTRAKDVAFLARDAALQAFDPARAVYLDIEATGLSGGSGTYPFLVALGAFGADGFEVWQGFMASPEEERSLLVQVADRIGAAGQMVSFFGKSYDRHRLEDKMRHHRIAPPFAECLHLDLYHPLRRLYSGSRPDDRLSTNERELCGVERRGDLSGAYAPAAWFDFVAERPHLLEEVFRHNLVDVLSLATLTAHLGAVSREESWSVLPGSAAHRARGLARLCDADGEYERAATWYARAIENAGQASECETLRLARARCLERVQDPAAQREYEELLEGASDDELAAEAGERLALVTHRAGDVLATRTALTRALARLERVPAGRAARELEARLRARLARLER